MGIVRQKRIKAGAGYIDALSVKLLSKNFILLKGSRGYIMCGYLNLKTAEKFKDVAVKVSGVSTIEEALESTVFSCTLFARRLGIHKLQPVREVLKIIA